jgi:hypothetical protein
VGDRRARRAGTVVVVSPTLDHDPGLYGYGNEVRTGVEADMAGHTAQDEQGRSACRSRLPPRACARRGSAEHARLPSSIGLSIKQDSVARCAPAVGTILEGAGHNPSGSLTARSDEGWGLKQPALGAGTKKKRGNASWQGHVGFGFGTNPRQIVLLGGSQGDTWSIAAFARRAHVLLLADMPLPAP